MSFSSLALIGFLDMDYLVGQGRRWRERDEGEDGDDDDDDDDDE